MGPRGTVPNVTLCFLLVFFTVTKRNNGPVTRGAVCTSNSALATHTDKCIRAFFFLLGWKLFSSRDKNMEFSAVLTALGVTVQMSAECRDGQLTIRNTAKRVPELVEIIKAVVQKGTLPKPLALKLRGRVHFAEGQLFGRIGRLCLRAVTDYAYGSEGTCLSSHCCSRSLVSASAMLEAAVPRTMRVGWDLPWFVYTDASHSPASESWQCGIGGILHDTSGSLVSTFSAALLSGFRAS